MVDFYKSESRAIFSCGLLLSPGQESEAVSISKAIASENEVRFQLSKEHRPPFIRLYEFVLPEDNISKAFEATMHMAQQMLPFHVEWSEIEQTNAFVAIWVKINEPLLKLQRATLLTLNPLREGEVKQKYQSERAQSFLSVQERQSVRMWGSPWADPYIPHMILAKAMTSFAVEPEVEWGYKTGIVRGMVFGTKEEDGEFLKFETVEFPSQP